MDPDDIVSELNLETDELLDKFWEKIEIYIEDNYYGDEEDNEDGTE
jgi:hypothetical protein